MEVSFKVKSDKSMDVFSMLSHYAHLVDEIHFYGFKKNEKEIDRFRITLNDSHGTVMLMNEFQKLAIYE